jgi:predicted nucleic-acid-binding protein
VIGLDTNVIVRFLAQDDEVQSRVAERLMARLSRERPGFISIVVLAEISWVLSRAYKAPRVEIAAAIEGLLHSADIVVENAEAAYRALALYRASASAEFADALIVQTGALAGVTETVTFDRNAAAEFGMRVLA